jgi:hypothetical protein
VFDLLSPSGIRFEKIVVLPGKKSPSLLGNDIKMLSLSNFFWLRRQVMEVTTNQLESGSYPFQPERALSLQINH